ncbi:hypothetical protein PVAG01_10791 [Phlyctema vagabunda]|uniref:Uncharacterized protein n=1 Tax=Phlyctema vagabunda TaxID=108571 RepID=A0ABR4P389_9HELO
MLELKGKYKLDTLFTSTLLFPQAYLVGTFKITIEVPRVISDTLYRSHWIILSYRCLTGWLEHPLSVDLIVSHPFLSYLYLHTSLPLNDEGGESFFIQNAEGWVTEGRAALTRKAQTVLEPGGAFESENEEGDGIFVSPGPESEPVVKTRVKQSMSRKSEPARQAKSLEEAEEYEEAGRGEKKRRRRRVQNEKRTVAPGSREYVSRFACLVEKDQDVLRQKIKKLNHASMKGDEEFLAVFERLHQSTSDNLPQQELKDLFGSNFSDKYTQCQKIHRNALSLVTKFEEASASVVEIDNAVPATQKKWNEEDEKMNRLLKTGLSVMESRVETALNGDSEGQEPLGAKNKQNVEKFFGKSDGKNTTAWGAAAKKHFKAYERFVAKVTAD